MFELCCHYFLVNPGYVLTAVSGFSLNKPKTDENNHGKSDQQWDITNNQRNGVVVTEHYSFSDENSGDENDDDNDKVSKEKNKKDENETRDQEEESVRMNQEMEEDKKLFENVENVYGGQNISLVVMPRFPEKHMLASMQKYVTAAMQLFIFARVIADITIHLLYKISNNIFRCPILDVLLFLIV